METRRRIPTGRQIRASFRTAQIALISILQGVAAVLLFDKHVRDILLPLSGGDLDVSRFFFAVLTFFIIALVTWLYFIEILCYPWGFPVIHVVVWFLVTGTEYVLALFVDELTIWFGAIGFLGVLGAIVYLFNLRQLAEKGGPIRTVLRAYLVRGLLRFLDVAIPRFEPTIPERPEKQLALVLHHALFLANAASIAVSGFVFLILWEFASDHSNGVETAALVMGGIILLWNFISADNFLDTYIRD